MDPPPKPTLEYKIAVIKNNIYEILPYWSLFFAVLVGGLFGNFLNLKIFSNRILALITSLLVIFVAVRMGLKIFIQ